MTPLYLCDGEKYIRSGGREIEPTIIPWPTALVAMRDFSGIISWGESNTGNLTAPTVDFGDVVLDEEWLEINEGPNVYYKDDRWFVTNFLASRIRFVTNNVTIRDFIIESGNGAGLTAFYGENPSGIIAEYGTLNGQGAGEWVGVEFPLATEPDQITIHRCKIFDYRVGIKVSGGITGIENYVRDLAYEGADPHTTSMSIRSGNVHLVRNILTDGNSAALALYNEVPPYTNILIEQNVFLTANSTYELAYTGSFPPGSNIIRLIDNLFQRGAITGVSNFSEVTGNVDANGNPVGEDFQLSKIWFQTNAGCPVPKNQLTPHTGSNTLSVPGALYENILFTDSVRLEAPGIRFRRCWFEAGPYGVIDGWENNSALPGGGRWLSDNAEFDQVTFECGEWTNCGALLRGVGWILRSVDIYGGQDGLKTGGSGRLRRVFVHDLSSGPDDHNDGIQLGDTALLDIAESWIESHNTGCISAFDGQAGAAYLAIVISRTYLGGGAGYLIYAGGASTTDFSLTNSALGSFGYGAITQLPVSGTFTWSGNYDYITGNPIIVSGS